MRYWLATGVLLSIFFVASVLAGRMKSPGWDEPAHIAAGISYVQTGVIAANLQHPPLLKELSGIALTLAGARWPQTPEAKALLRGESKWQWPVGITILNAFGVGRTLLWARLPMILIAVMLGAIIFLWGRQLFGNLAALAALFLYVCDPTITAHSSLVTMDVGFAAFTLLFCFALWNYVSAPSAKRMVFCGIALGLLLCTKFSSVAVLPAAGVLAVVAWRTVQYVAAPNDSCPCGSGRKFKNCHANQPRLLTIGGFLGIPAVALGIIEIVYLFNSPFLYLTGLGLVNSDHLNYPVLMAGNLAPRFTSYFAVAYLLKEPLASIGLAVAGVVMLLRSRKTSPLTQMFLLVPPGVIFAAHVMKADNLGIRYIIPVLPFAHLLGGLALARLTEILPAGRAIAGVLCGWIIVAAAGIYPDGLSYFNESACLLTDPGRIGLDGGSRCGTAWLDDSNVDWGLGLDQLKNWQDKNATGRGMRLSYFGSFPPEAYGVSYGVLDDRTILTATRPAPGLYAINAHNLARASGWAKAHSQTIWAQTMPPAAIVGHAYYIFDIP